MTRERESFRQRVEELRYAWSERRQIRSLASVHDFESQFELLRLLHQWAEEAVADIRRVYDDELHIQLDPTPGAQDRPPAFSLSIGGEQGLSFSLAERPRGGGTHWFISVTIGPAVPGASPIAAGPQRRAGQWTRGQFQDLVLSALGAFERSLSHRSPGSQR
jgi:hypothetical protein